jgi:hypothetical protein
MALSEKVKKPNVCFKFLFQNSGSFKESEEIVSMVAVASSAIFDNSCQVATTYIANS